MTVKGAAGHARTAVGMAELPHGIAVEINGEFEPMLFAPTIGAAIAARHWWLWVRCPACRTTNAIDLRNARPSSRRGDHQPNPRAVLPVMPAECAVCRAGAAVAPERRRRMECGAGQGGAGRVSAGSRPNAR